MDADTEVGMKLKFNRIVGSVLLFDVLFWVYFWVSFILASRPDAPPYVGAFFDFGPPLPQASVWGYSLWYINPREHSFLIAASILQFPCWVIAVLLREAGFFVAWRMLDHTSTNPFPFTLGWKVLGIDTGGWVLIITMMLSFLQWYLIGRLVSWTWRRVKKT